MSGLEPISARTNQLSQAILESVHFASSIQPHGLLFALSDPDLVVLQASANIEDYFGVLPQTLVGQPLGVLLHGTAIALIQQAVKRLSAEIAQR